MMLLSFDLCQPTSRLVNKQLLPGTGRHIHKQTQAHTNIVLSICCTDLIISQTPYILIYYYVFCIYVCIYSYQRIYFTSIFACIIQCIFLDNIMHCIQYIVNFYLFIFFFCHISLKIIKILS